MPVSLCLRESNNFWMLKSNLINQGISQIVRVVFNSECLKANTMVIAI